MNMTTNKIKKVDIFGTCYTRELFNTTAEYQVNTYLMQQSIFTMFSKPLNIGIEDAISHDNFNFKKRMIYYEFNKMGLNRLLDKSADYLIIDLSDGARDIFEFKEPLGVKIVDTHDIELTLKYLKKKEKYKNISMKSFDVRNYSDDEIKIYLKIFIDEILKKYNPEKIILNRVQMQNIYYDNNVRKTIDNSFIYNRYDFIKRLENIFLKLLPNCKLLYTKYEPVLDINHRFGGPHPMHFEHMYYEYRMNVLNAIINDDKAFDEINKTYKDMYEQTISQIKSKTIKL